MEIHAGYVYYNSFINSKEYYNVTVNLLLPVPIDIQSAADNKK